MPDAKKGRELTDEHKNATSEANMGHVVIDIINDAVHNWFIEEYIQEGVING